MNRTRLHAVIPTTRRRPWRGDDGAGQVELDPGQRHLDTASGLRLDDEGRILICPPGPQQADRHLCRPGQRPQDDLIGCGGRDLQGNAEDDCYTCTACGLQFDQMAAGRAHRPAPGQLALPLGQEG
jgi:hypothetical protein